MFCFDYCIQCFCVCVVFNGVLYVLFTMFLCLCCFSVSVLINGLLKVLCSRFCCKRCVQGILFSKLFLICVRKIAFCVHAVQINTVGNVQISQC